MNSTRVLGLLNSPAIRFFLLFFFFVVFSSCDGNYRNINLTGKLIDGTSSKPINDIEVEVTFWVYDMSNIAWESKEISKIVRTNKNGEFIFRLSKAESFDLQILNTKYKDYYYSQNLNSSHIDLKIALARK